MSHDPNRHLGRQARQIQSLLEQATEDRRLTDAQRYIGLVEVFGCDPLILAGKRLQRAMDHRSKITTPKEAIQKLLIMMHDRVVPMPDHKARKRSEDDSQFELKFSWSLDNPEAGGDQDREAVGESAARQPRPM